MKRDERRIWFHAKTYGYGWGLPASWQGWVVYIGYGLLLWAGWARFGHERFWFFAYALLLTALLLGICLLKGEKARWRWGRRDEE